MDVGDGIEFGLCGFFRLFGGGLRRGEPFGDALTGFLGDDEGIAEQVGAVFAGAGDVTVAVEFEHQGEFVVHAVALDAGEADFLRRGFARFFVLVDDVIGFGAHGGDDVEARVEDDIDKAVVARRDVVPCGERVATVFGAGDGVGEFEAATASVPLVGE